MRSGCSATGNNSFNSLVGTGSNKHVVGLDAVISLFSSSCPIVVKHCSFSLGAMNEAEVLDAVESTFVIVFLMLSIFSVNKFIKSLLLNCEGIFRSGGICLIVHLATVLNKHLGLFWIQCNCHSFFLPAPHLPFIHLRSLHPPSVGLLHGARMHLPSGGSTVTLVRVCSVLV